MFNSKIRLAAASGSTTVALTSTYRMKEHESAPNMQLVQVQLLFRHGARTPIHSIYGQPNVDWPALKILEAVPFNLVDARFGNKLGPHSMLDEAQLVRRIGNRGASVGQLTGPGMQMAKDLGSEIRERYSNITDSKSQPFLPQKYDPSAVYSRTTHVRRTIDSLRCVLSGLYPELDRPDAEPVRIYSVPILQEWILPNSRNCKTLRELMQTGRDTFQSSLSDRDRELFRDIAASLDTQDGDLSPWASKLDPAKPSMSLYIVLNDIRSSHGYHNLPACPPIEDPNNAQHIEDQAVRQMLHYIVGNGSHEHQRLGARVICGRFFGDMGARIVDAILEEEHSCPLTKDITVESKVLKELKRPTDDVRLYPFGHPYSTPSPRLVLYSSHDSMVTALLYALGIFDGRWPPFVANLAFELYKVDNDCDDALTTAVNEPGPCIDDGKYRVRVLYNFKPVVLPGAESECATLQELHRVLQNTLHSPAEWQDECCAAVPMSAGRLMQLDGKASDETVTLNEGLGDEKITAAI